MSFNWRILVGVYIFLLLSIPVGAYVVSQQQTNLQSRASEPKPLPTSKPSPALTGISTGSAQQSPAKQLATLSESKVKTSPKPSPTSEATPSPTIAKSFGPTLSGKITLEGRPKDNMATKLFVGILEGTASLNPKFLLSFMIDVPALGEFSNLSLAGLSTGATYTALLKGSAQIATSSSFLMSPTVTKLNQDNPLTLLSGDLNDDNTINSLDYSIAKAALGTTPKSSSWNDNIDFNKDGVVNTLDLSIVTKNLGKTGATGVWTSPLPTKTATASGSLTPVDVGSPSPGGYWIWIPPLDK